MDCLSATEIISAAHDGTPVDPEALDRARAHCDTCPECAAFVATLARMEQVAPPHAPLPLVERIIDVTRAQADAAHTPVEQGALSGATAPVQHRSGRLLPSWWQPRMTAFVSAAAVVILGVVVSLALIGQAGLPGGYDGPSPSPERSTIDATAEDSGGADAGESGTGAAEAPTKSAPTTATAAPPYVVWDGTVYVHTGELREVPSEATTVGVTVSDLGLPEGPRERPVLAAHGDQATIYVRSADGRFMIFERVVRTLGLRKYALVTDQAIPTFGTWPQLPSRFETPSAGGSPDFARIGFDDRNVDVYVPPGAEMTDGFAVAPGTPSDDPAAGNPYWTWWEPLP